MMFARLPVKDAMRKLTSLTAGSWSAAVVESETRRVEAVPDGCRRRFWFWPEAVAVEE